MKKWCLIGALAALWLTSCAQTNQERISLTEGWEYAVTNPADGDANFTALPDTALQNLETLVKDGQGFIWLKKQFSVPAALANQPLGCYLGRITLADETTLNGAFIGGEGRFPPAEFSAWNKVRLYTIPQNLLTAANTLLVKIWVDGEGSIVSGPFIGTLSDTAAAAQFETFWASRIQLVFAFLMLIIGAYHFLLYVKSPKERDNVAFALINVLSALYLSVFYYVELPGKGFLPFLWFQKIFSSGLPYLFPFLVTMYVNTFLKRRERRIIEIIRAAFVAVPLIIVFLCPTYQVLRRLQPLVQGMLVPPMVYLLYILGSSVVKKQKDSLALLIGFSPLVLTVLLDFLIHSVFHLYGFPYITSIGWQLVIITLLFIMANRFVNSRLQVEYLNRNLEKEVADRTKELSESNEQLSLTNAELEAAKKRADRDMQLAEYVQQSFYQHTTPLLEDWEVIWHFQPMAGVSGDLYDLFYDGGHLQGVGLFDVSGHGIASGLVTMLAKTIIDRTFQEERSTPLAQVVKDINEKMVEAKGDIENYLTGVLLRMKGNKVEYVSAGHPKAFFRAKTGKTCAIEVAGKATGSSIIGMPMIETDYTAIGFSVHSGDSILLYTDALTESRNKDGLEYGYERIASVFSSGGETAQEKLQAVLDDFAHFTKGMAAHDDLTVIVLQKK